MPIGDLVRQLFTSRRKQWDNEGARMMAFVQSDTEPDADAGDPGDLPPPDAAATSPGNTVREHTRVRPDGAVVHTRVERHEEFRVVDGAGRVTVYDSWDDLPPELQAAFRRSLVGTGAE